MEYTDVSEEVRYVTVDAFSIITKNNMQGRIVHTPNSLNLSGQEKILKYVMCGSTSTKKYHINKHW